jgi:hypothetical protein
VLQADPVLVMNIKYLRIPSLVPHVLVLGSAPMHASLATCSTNANAHPTGRLDGCTDLKQAGIDVLQDAIDVRASTSTRASPPLPPPSCCCACACSCACSSYVVLVLVLVLHYYLIDIPHAFG